MVYAMPPQITNVNSNARTRHGHVRTWQDSRSTASAKQSVAFLLPKSTVVELFHDKDGKPTKAYVKDAHGKLKTVTFDGKQQIMRIANGCH
jgi:hypothetical protein